MILKQIKQSIYWLPSICLVTLINHEKNRLHLSGDANEQAVHTSLRKQYSCCAIIFFHPMGAPFPYPLRPGERRTGASKCRITPHLKKSLHCSSLLFGCEIWRPFWQQWGQTTSTQSLNCPDKQSLYATLEVRGVTSLTRERQCLRYWHRTIVKETTDPLKSLKNLSINNSTVIWKEAVMLPTGLMNILLTLW